MEGSKKLNEILSQEDILIAPGCYDCITALIAETVGFEVVYLSGYGSSASLLGLPDLGLMTFSEILSHARNVVNCVKVPVICDADNGYGNHLNVVRTVREFEKVGVAAIHIEDQVFPKKCGHLDGKQVISAEEHVQKIRAAVDTRNEMLIIARTDSRSPCGFNESIKRANMYLDAGADLAFVDALQSKDEIEYAGKLVNGPLIINLTEGGKTPLISADELENYGYRIIIYSDSAINTAKKAVSATFRELKTKKTTVDILHTMEDFNEFNKFIKTDDYVAIDKKYQL